MSFRVRHFLNLSRNFISDNSNNINKHDVTACKKAGSTGEATKKMCPNERKHLGSV